MVTTPGKRGMTSPVSAGTASKGGNVKVFCRVRPQNKMEVNKGGGQVVHCTEETVTITMDDDAVHTFTFDGVLGEDDQQTKVFESTARPIMEDVLQGYNATILAYGQTSSGKTYTMEGPDIHDDRLKGVVPRSLGAIFEGVRAADQNIEFTVKVSYIEIYMEKIRDLLDEYHTKENLQIREDPRRGIYVAGATEEYVTNEDELLDIMHDGARNRAVSATGMNEGSSRSHSVFIITLTQRNIETASTKSGMLYLVDLAGSEMVRKTNASGQQLEEAKKINKSLSALGQVINALTDDKSTHVPYRDSKLTRVLQNSLGGNSKTSLIINCSPSSYNANETLSTLRFGQRAKNIKNKAVVNEVRSVEELSVLLQKAEGALDMQQTYIIALEAQLKQADGQSPGASPAEGETANALGQLQEKVKSLTTSLEEEREELKRQVIENNTLTSLLKDKERMLVEAGELMKEAERHCEIQRDKADKLLAEKSDAFSEAENLRNKLQEEREKQAFEVEELMLSIEKLSKEKSRLSAELEEFLSNGGNKKRASSNNSLLSAKDSDAGSAKGTVADDVSLNPEDEDDGRSRETDLTSDDIELSVDDAFGEETMETLKVKAREWLVEKKRYERELRTVNESLSKAKTDYEAKLSVVENARNKLTDDLEDRIQKVAELEAVVQKSGDGENATSNAAMAKQMQHMKSMQQRLEQLVAVHRQLLRKYASLELENTELKKKINHRDERIKQLENNAKVLAANMCAQGERHVLELTKLREQVSILREEQQKQLDFRFASETPRGHNLHEVRSIRGGKPEEGVVRKIIRGGGGGGGVGSIRSAESVSSDVDDRRSRDSFLSRLFPSKDG